MDASQDRVSRHLRIARWAKGWIEPQVDAVTDLVSGLGAKGRGVVSVVHLDTESPRRPLKWERDASTKLATPAAVALLGHGVEAEPLPENLDSEYLSLAPWLARKRAERIAAAKEAGKDARKAVDAALARRRAAIVALAEERKAAEARLRAIYEEGVDRLLAETRLRSGMTSTASGLDCPLHDEVEASMGVLDERQGAVFRACVGWDGGAPATRVEVGAALGVTYQRASQILMAARDRMDEVSGWPSALAVEAAGMGQGDIARSWWAEGIDAAVLGRLVALARSSGDAGDRRATFEAMVREAEAAALALPPCVTPAGMAMVALGTLPRKHGTRAHDLLSALGMKPCEASAGVLAWGGRDPVGADVVRGVLDSLPPGTCATMGGIKASLGPDRGAKAGWAVRLLVAAGVLSCVHEGRARLYRRAGPDEAP